MQRYFDLLGLFAVSGCLALVVNTTAMAQSPDTISPKSVSMTPELQLSQANATGVNQVTEELQTQPQTPLEAWGEALGLTDKQKTDIEAIFSLYQPQIEESARAYFEALDALNQVLVPTNDSQVIVAARNTVVTHERATYDLLFQRNIAIREVLDPTQRAVINTALRDLLDLDSLAELPEQLQFPDNLMGQSAETAVASLTRDGWQVVAETPGLVQLDRGQESLDLDVNRNGIITGFNLR
jgi:Spy/CpxP family protein refolding chaperone